MEISMETESMKKYKENRHVSLYFPYAFHWIIFFLALISGLIPLLSRPYITTSIFRRFSQAERDSVS
jgi:hypothetical protein